MKGQRDALESELNDAMVELIYTDFLLANFDLQTLFLDSLDKYYSEEVVLWFQDELTHGKIPSFQRIPVKLGLKNVKAISRITYLAEEPRDYWAERGYSRYDGI
jgi:hypothetical protein